MSLSTQNTPQLCDTADTPELGFYRSRGSPGNHNHCVSAEQGDREIERGVDTRQRECGAVVDVLPQT